MKKKTVFNIVFYVFLIALAIIWILPIISVALTSIKSSADFFSGESLFSIPEHPQWGNFAKAWTKGKLGLYMKNGIIISLMKVPLGILVEALAAFGLTRLNIKHRTGLFMFFLLGMMLPHQMALIPLNRIFTKFHLINNYGGLFIVYIGFGIGYGILVLRGFMRSIPKELDEAAYLDGCGTWGLFWRVILPNIKPAMATLFILDFLSTWNEFLLQSILVTKDTLRTVPNGLIGFIGEFGTDYGLLNAGVLISIIPVLIVYLIFQKYFVEGMAGAVKQ